MTQDCSDGSKLLEDEELKKKKRIECVIANGYTELHWCQCKVSFKPQVDCDKMCPMMNCDSDL